MGVCHVEHSTIGVVGFKENGAARQHQELYLLAKAFNAVNAAYPNIHFRVYRPFAQPEIDVAAAIKTWDSQPWPKDQMLADCNIIIRIGGHDALRQQVAALQAEHNIELYEYDL